MIETKDDLNRFNAENTDGDWFMHIVPVEDDAHPVVNRPSILFIRNISTGKTYYFAINHPDSASSVEFEDFFQNILLNTNIKWVLDKKTFTQILNFPDIFDANLANYLTDNSIVELNEYDTPAHHLVRKNASGHNRVNLAIPLLKHKEMFDELADDVTRIINKYNIDEAFAQFNELIIGTLGKLEQNGIFVNREKFSARFNVDPGATGMVRSQYNVYTSTGRPSNRFDGVNYAALNHTDGARACFVSRYGNDGKMVVVDYTAFHPRIICNLTNYSIPIDTDIYEYLSKLYFNKKSVDETDIKNSKQLTFRQLYGGVEDKYSHIKYFSNLKTFIDNQWELFQKNGYVLTPIFKRKITDKHIQDPNPSKVFNYILQAVEGEIAIPRLRDVMEYLGDKKTKAILYTYDAVLYDFHKNDGIETLNEIRKIMSCDGMFPIKTYIGDSYHDVRLINV